jgi:hypothetical protein
MPPDRRHPPGGAQTIVGAVNTSRLNQEQLAVYEKVMAGTGVFITGDAHYTTCISIMSHTIL